MLSKLVETSSWKLIETWKLVETRFRGNWWKLAGSWKLVETCKVIETSEVVETWKLKLIETTKLVETTFVGHMSDTHRNFKSRGNLKITSMNSGNHEKKRECMCDKLNGEKSTKAIMTMI